MTRGEACTRERIAPLLGGRGSNSADVPVSLRRPSIRTSASIASIFPSRKATAVMAAGRDLALRAFPRQKQPGIMTRILSGTRPTRAPEALSTRPGRLHPRSGSIQLISQLAANHVIHSLPRHVPIFLSLQPMLEHSGGRIANVRILVSGRRRQPQSSLQHRAVIPNLESRSSQGGVASRALSGSRTAL